MRRAIQPRNRERGNTIVEFALVATLLVPMIAGLFTVGLALTRSQQVMQVNRDIGALYVKGVKMNTDSSKRMMNRLSRGLGLGPSPVVDYDEDAIDEGGVGGGASYPLPSSTGNGVVYLSEVTRVSEIQCEQGGFPAPTYSGCTNYDQYVFTERIDVGNSSLRASDAGTPVGPFDPDRRILPADFLTKTGNRAQNFKSTPTSAGILHLEKGVYTKMTESFFKLDELSFLIRLDMSLNSMDESTSGVYVRNVY